MYKEFEDRVIQMIRGRLSFGVDDTLLSDMFSLLGQVTFCAHGNKMPDLSLQVIRMAIEALEQVERARVVS